MRLKKWNKVLICCLCLFLLQKAYTTKAFAHHPIISGTIACTNSQQVVTWKIQNSETTSTMSIAAINPSITGISVGDSVVVGATLTGTQTLPGTQTGTTSLTVTGHWTDGVSDTETANVTLSGTCIASTPTSQPTAVPTATSIPTQMPTPTPGATTITLTVFEHSIGSSGDNSNPNSDFSNKNPQHPQITASIQIFTLQNQLLLSPTGTVTFDAGSGSFKGNITIPNGNLPTTATYYIKVKTNSHLQALVPGLQTITLGQTNQITPVTLVAGDINNDNIINIQDYNILINCYSDLATASSCSPEQKIAADLNDDGSVNLVDFNLFLRELASQPGK